MSIVRSLLPRGDADRLLPCAVCATPFRPGRTRGECPVCGWQALAPSRRLPFPGIDQLDLAVVLAVTAINLGLLLVLVLVISKR
jgi:hypothetical protein